MTSGRGPATPARALAISACIGLFVTAGSTSAQAATRYVPDRVNVVFESAADAGDRAQSRGAADVDLQDVLGRTRFQSVEVRDGQTVAGALRELRADPDVAAASRDVLRRPLALPNDPKFADNTLWGLRNAGGATGPDGFANPLLGADIGAVSAWDKVAAKTGPLIADLDDGYTFDHPDLTNVFWSNLAEGTGVTGVDDDGNGRIDDVRGWDFVGTNSSSPGSGDNDPTDDDFIDGGHGSHTAGTIAAQGNNNQGIVGVAQANPDVAKQARVMALRVCGPGADGIGGEDAGCPDSAQIAAVNYAGKNGARVANMSLGGESTPAEAAPFVEALKANPGLLVVAAAGNENANNDATPSYPCNANPIASGGTVDNVICVAASNQRDELATSLVTGDAGFSNYGVNSVDLSAPGTEISSSVPRRNLLSEDFEGEDPLDGWTKTAGAVSAFSLHEYEDEDEDDPQHDIIAKPDEDETYSSTSSAVAVPAGVNDCRLAQKVTVDGDGTYSYRVLRNGTATYTSGNFTTSGVKRSPSISSLAGQSVRVVVSYTAPEDDDDGVRVDNIKLTCAVSGANAYEFEQGTSMAAPHVSGAAGLLFALKPTATVAEVRNALLSSVDARSTMYCRTVTGGRLNASRALDRLASGGTSTATPCPPPDNGGGNGSTGTGGNGSTGTGGGQQISGIAPIVLSLGSAPGSLTVDKKGQFTYTFTAKGTGAGAISFTTQKALASAKKKPKKRKLLLGKKSFRATPDGKVKVSIKLSGKALKALKKAKRLGVSVQVTLGSRKAARTLTIKAPKAKKKKKK